MSSPTAPTTLEPSPAKSILPDSAITIATPRLLLRAALPTDAPALHAIFSNPDAMRYWSTLPHTTLAQTSAWLAKMIAGPQNGVTDFVLCLRTPVSAAASAAPGVPPEGPPDGIVTGVPSDASPAGGLAEGPGEVIGKAGIWHIDDASGGEVGFLLHRTYWRQGLMREVLEVLLPYFFKPVSDGGRGLEVITADADPRNAASLGFLAGLGFEVTGRQERTLQVGPYGVEDPDGGEWVDSVYLALRREVWMEREKGRRRDGGVCMMLD